MAGLIPAIRVLVGRSIRHAVARDQRSKEAPSAKVIFATSASLRAQIMPACDHAGTPPLPPFPSFEPPSFSSRLRSLAHHIGMVIDEVLVPAPPRPAKHPGLPQR